MVTLALDVDGVLLDPDRNGRGHWTNDLNVRLGITNSEIQEAFFMRSWDDVVNGRRSIEEGLGEALAQIGASADIDSVLSCWFDADYFPFEATFELARRAAAAGHRIVLATNQEHRRAEYLRKRIGAVVPLDHVLYSAKIGYQKHARQFFEVASECLGVDAAERSSVVFVDDVMDNVEVARSFGWRAVHAAADQPWRAEVEQLLGLQTAIEG
jgi:putative hydrolase of the HAD superfamily